MGRASAVMDGSLGGLAGWVGVRWRRYQQLDAEVLVSKERTTVKH